VVPHLFNPLRAIEDSQLAAQALALLGTPTGGKGTCQGCHAMSGDRLRDWANLGGNALGKCLDDLDVTSQASAQRMVRCLRADVTVPTSPFTPRKLGWLAAAAHLGWFDALFKRAYGADGPAQLTAFRSRSAMPKGGAHAWTQAEFDVVAEWFNRDLPLLDDLLPSEPPPADCVSTITPAMTSHVAAMKTTGWRTLNRERGLLMFGCQNAATTKDCLASYPLASTKPYGEGWESLSGAKLRILRENDYSSQFWTKSSADGRFVAHGGGPPSDVYGATIIDLSTSRVIPTEAAYDPGFFADNSGFMFQTSADGARACELSVLTSAPATLHLNEPGCTNTPGIELYQQIGVGLSGKDYWVITAEFSSDDGGKEPTLSDPSAFFLKFGRTQLTPMVHTGNGYTRGATREIETPYEGDAVLSPSARLFASRLAGPGGVPRGYTLRSLPASPPDDPRAAIPAPEIARYCIPGGKPSFSFDERWMVVHHYVTADDAADLGFASARDPGFQAYVKQGAANIYLIDLATGARKRVTRMQPGQYALYPHFRSDGWIYFLVRTPGQATTEIVVASDAAVVLDR